MLYEVITVPFLVFAIGVSHGAQKMNGIMQDIGRGTHNRITSYNVCYTKLLRLSSAESEPRAKTVTAIFGRPDPRRFLSRRCCIARRA